MQQRGSKYFARRPAPTYTGTPTLWMGSVGKKSFFSVHGHVTYQIKEKYFGRPLPPPPTLGMGSVGQNIFLSTWTCCISK